MPRRRRPTRRGADARSARGEPSLSPAARLRSRAASTRQRPQAGRAPGSWRRSRRALPSRPAPSRSAPCGFAPLLRAVARQRPGRAAHPAVRTEVEARHVDLDPGLWVGAEAPLRREHRCAGQPLVQVLREHPAHHGVERFAPALARAHVEPIAAGVAADDLRPVQVARDARPTQLDERWTATPRSAGRGAEGVIGWLGRAAPARSERRWPGRATPVGAAARRSSGGAVFGPAADQRLRVAI